MGASMSKFEQRCNDPQARREWESSGLVRIDSLKRLDVFECISGHFWQVESRNRTGTIHARAWDGGVSETDFISSAMVRPVMRKTTYVPEGA